MKKTYTTFEEIEFDLKRLNLERQIAYEELKGIKGEFKEDLQPANWVQSIIGAVSKYGLFVIFKRIFSK